MLTTRAGTFTNMPRPSETPIGHLIIPATLALCVFATPVFGQERRWVVFGSAGVASIGHADSEQGKAPVAGGALGFKWCGGSSWKGKCTARERGTCSGGSIMTSAS
jgi:hypothetical protein